MIARRPTRARRRAFLMLTVMVLFFVATLMITWGLQRLSMQSRIAEMRLDDYRLHHERLGLMALAERWLIREDAESLKDLSEATRAAYVASLPNDVEVTMYARDAQGLLCSRVEDAGSAQGMLLDALRRIPPGRSDLIRAHGPVGISVEAAPIEVLEAIAGENGAVLELLMRLRDEPPEDERGLDTEISREMFEEENLPQKLDILLTAPTTLWRLDTEVRDRRGSRRYEILIELIGNRPKTHTCRLLSDAEIERRGRQRDRR